MSIKLGIKRVVGFGVYNVDVNVYKRIKWSSHKRMRL
jgi:hypothetical protein